MTESDPTPIPKEGLLQRAFESIFYFGLLLIGFAYFYYTVLTRFLLLSLWQLRKPWEDFPIREELTDELFHTNPSYGRHRTINVNGHDFHCVEAGQQNGELVLFLHGFPECWYAWRHQLKAFHNDNRYHLVAIDLKGYGASYKPTNLDEFRPSQLVADIEATIHALGHERSILVGHDWGGIIAWSVASRRPDLVYRLVAINAPYHPLFKHNTSFKNPEISKKAVFTQILRLYYAHIFKLPEPLPSIWLNWRGKERLRSMVPDSDSDHEADKYLTALSVPGVVSSAIKYYKVGLDPLVAPLNMETLVIWGQDDRALVEEVCLTGLENYVDDLQVLLLEGTSHFAPEDDPKRVNEILQKFFQSGNENQE